MSAVLQDQWTCYDRPAMQRLLQLQGTQARAQLAIEGMHCGGCALKIEKRLRQIAGVKEVTVNGATKHMQMTWNSRQVRFSDLLRAIAGLGFHPHVLGEKQGDATVQERRTALKRIAVAGLGMAQVMTFAFPLYFGAGRDMEPRIELYLRAVSMLICIPVVFYSAVPFFSGAWRELKSRRPGMDTPVSLAIALAFAASVFNTVRNSGEVYFDSVAMFVFLLLAGRFIEMQVRHRSGSVTEALARLLPDSVQRLRGSSIENVVPAQLRAGDRIQIPSGAVIAADGRVLQGTSAVDESLLTGESAPLPRTVGDSVIGGSLNIGNPLQVEVTAAGARTVLSNIVRLLEQAQSERPRLGRAADRVAAYFIAGVLFLGVAVAAFWMYFDPARAFPATLAVLVVTCPCALSLATPVAIAAATSRLAKLGLLVTHADAIEALAQVRRCVFDKTGTLTQGSPKIAAVFTLGERSREDCLHIAGALERQSEHPLANAFAAAAVLSAENVRVLRGQGVEGDVAGHRYRIGQLDFVRELCPAASMPSTMQDAHIFLGDSSGLLAAFAIDDALRTDAVRTTRRLQALGIETEIASGDHRDAVERVAGRLNIARWQARLTPQAKLEHIRELNVRPGGVLMIGDGINDAPVLGAARVSIAMGGGSALAHASADAILMSPSLNTVAESIEVSRHALRIVKQNLWWAAGYNLLSVPLAAAGLLPPWAAAIGMSVSSLVVVLNAARLSRPRRSATEPAVTPLMDAARIPA